MDKINFDLVGNNQDLIKKINEAQAAFVSLGKTAEEQGRRINATFDNISLESVKQLRLTLLGMPIELRGIDSIKKQISDLDRQLGQIEKELSQMIPSANKTTGISTTTSLISVALETVGGKLGTLNVAGKASVPIWRQVTSSLFSWHMGLKVGITLFSLYGDKLLRWLGNALKIDEVSQSMNKTQQEVNETLKSLQERWIDLGDNMSTKKRFIEENKSAFDDLGIAVTSIKDAENLLVNNTPAFIESLKLRAQAAAAQKLASDKYQEAMILRNNANIESGKEYSFLEKQGNYFKSVWRGIWGEDSDLSLETRILTQRKENVEALNEEASEAEAAAETYFDLSRAKELAAGLVLNNNGIKEFHNPPLSSPTNDFLRQQVVLKEAIQKAVQERKNIEIATELELQQERIDLMEDGEKKTMAQIQLNYSKRLLEIKKKKRDILQLIQSEERANWEKENPNWEKKGLTFTPKTTVLPTKELTQIQEMYSNADNAMFNEKQAYYDVEKQGMNEYLKEYGTYQEKRKAITELYDDKIAKAATKGERKTLEAQRGQALSVLDVDANKKTAAFSKLFADMKDRTVEDMINIAAEAQAALDYVNAGKFKTDSKGNGFYGISQETFNLLRKSPEELEKVKQGIKDTKAEAANFDNAFTKMAGGFKTLFEEGADPKKFQEGLAQIEGAMNEVMGAGKLLSNSLSSLGDAFGSDALKGIAEGMNAAMDAASATMDGVKMGFAIGGPFGAAAGAAIGLATSLASSIAKIHDAKNEKRIKRLQEQIDKLNRSYDKLGDSVEKAYSSDASQLIEQQNRLLEQQKLLIRNQIMEEQSKKNSDDGRIKEWQNQIEDINKTLAENKEKQIDVIFGQDVKSAIDNFAQAYADAWAAGDDRAKTSKDFVKNMIKQMILESIKAASSKPMEELRQRLAGFFSDGIISAWEQEQIEKDAAKLMDSLDSKFAWADRFMKDEDKDEEETTREASSKGIAQASQDSVDKLDGVMTNIQGHTYSINENVRAILDSMNGNATPGMPGTGKTADLGTNTVSLADIDRNMSSMIGLGNVAVSHLSSIADNTSRLATIEQTMSSIKLGIDTMNTKGITIKR